MCFVGKPIRCTKLDESSKEGRGKAPIRWNNGRKMRDQVGGLCVSFCPLPFDSFFFSPLRRDTKDGRMLQAPGLLRISTSSPRRKWPDRTRETIPQYNGELLLLFDQVWNKLSVCLFLLRLTIDGLQCHKFNSSSFNPKANSLTRSKD